MVMLSTLAGSEELPAWIDNKINNNCQVHAVQIIEFSSETASIIQARIAKYNYGLD